jgi:acyl carrier protein
MRDLMSEVMDVFRDVFEDDNLVVTRETTAADVLGWDSVKHVTLMLNVERRFNIRLSSSEVSDMKNVGDLIAIVERRLADRN